MPGPTESPAPWSLPRIRASLVLKAIVAFAVSIGVWLIIRDVYAAVVGRIASAVVNGFEGREFATLRDGGWDVTTLLRRGGSGPPLAAHLDRTTVLLGCGNLVLFLFGVAMTPPARLRRFPGRAGGGAALLLASHVVVFGLSLVARHEAAWASAGHARVGEGTLWALLAGINAYLTVLAPVVPFVLLLPMWLTRARTTVPPAAVAGASRNDPCPCGSGKKFKRCCGRSP